MDFKILVDDNELDSLLEQFYSYFEDGYVFEEFLREYLLKMGLDEVEVTQRSKDGGIDLKAIRKGVGDFSETDITHYYIQAKRYKPTSSISVKDVRQLKGTMLPGYKCIFITTSSFSKDCLLECGINPNTPVVLIDGKTLVQSCIDNKIGFVYKPVFSKVRMDEFFRKINLNSLDTIKEETNIELNTLSNESVDYVEKKLTLNDIRARIISMPSSIHNKLDTNFNQVKVLFNNKEYIFNISTSTRKFLSGVTNFFKENSIIQEDNSSQEKMFKWYYNNDSKSITLIETELK